MRWNFSSSIHLPNLKFLASLVLNLQKESQNFKIWPLVPIMLPFGYYIILEMGNTKFELSIYTHSKFRKGVLKFTNLASVPHHTPFAGILSSMRLDIHICVLDFKFLGTLTLNFRNGSKNLQIWLLDTNQTPFGVFCHPWGGTCQSLINIPNLKFLATPIPNLLKGSKIYKFNP